jgi:hypothetical protein
MCDSVRSGRTHELSAMSQLDTREEADVPPALCVGVVRFGCAEPSLLPETSARCKMMSPLPMVHGASVDVSDAVPPTLPRRLLSTCYGQSCDVPPATCWRYTNETALNIFATVRPPLA